MGAAQELDQKPHHWVADEQDRITCGCCHVALEAGNLACTGVNVTVAAPHPDFMRMVLGEIEPEDYARRLHERSRR